MGWLTREVIMRFYETNSPDMAGGKKWPNV